MNAFLLMAVCLIGEASPGPYQVEYLNRLAPNEVRYYGFKGRVDPTKYSGDTVTFTRTFYSGYTWQDASEETVFKQAQTSSAAASIPAYTIVRYEGKTWFLDDQEKNYLDVCAVGWLGYTHHTWTALYTTAFLVSMVFLGIMHVQSRTNSTQLWVYFFIHFLACVVFPLMSSLADLPGTSPMLIIGWSALLMTVGSTVIWIRRRPLDIDVAGKQMEEEAVPSA